MLLQYGIGLIEIPGGSIESSEWVRIAVEHPCMIVLADRFNAFTGYSGNYAVGSGCTCLGKFASH